MEFTIENGKLFMLQTRNGKRTADAAIQIVCDLVDDEIITDKEAVLRIDPNQLDQLLHPKFDAKELKNSEVIAKGLPASPGAASGKIYFNAEDAVNAADKGEEVVLVRLETSPEDIEGMVKAQGILTARGGMTSHAAVVARGMGKCCVAGCGALKVDEPNKEITVNDLVLKEGDYISIDGSTGNVYAGNIGKTEVSLSGNFGRLMSWVDKYKQMAVRTNADNPRDSRAAIRFGAEGIGLCRTEHMFFEEDRIPAVREMILSDTVEEREKALIKILPMQQEDFTEMFKVMEGRPVNIRLLDPPLHEFLPQDDESIEELANSMGKTFKEIKKKVVDLHEFNPMLGHRGCRLSITYPEICVMQVTAIIQGAIEAKKSGVEVSPEIMVPLVGEVKELEVLRTLIVSKVEEILARENVKINYTVGTMIEIPRACIVSDEIAQVADFYSFGTNDLTQMSYGYSRDDAGKFLGEYVDRGILEKDPFQVLDQNGVGKLMKMAVKLGKEVKPNIKLGICGEHGGEPSSVEFCYNLGLNYVSCSPYRVPIARLAAAQASIKNPRF
jgi:pyruvate,orthophosphate dikinase